MPPSLAPAYADTDISGLIDANRVVTSVFGFGATAHPTTNDLPDLTTDDYADAQLQVNARKAIDFILPQITARRARRVVDVGCGVGEMVKTLHGQGLDAYGVDLSGMQSRWKQLAMPEHRLFVVSPDDFKLPFHDASIDFAFSLGVIEHVGTTDGHADRRADYHAVRSRWVQEIYRTLKVGGSMLLAGPNRGFPVDVAHGLDSRSNRVERWLSAKAKVSIHKTWGPSFLWGYADMREYLRGLPCTMQPLSVSRYVHYSRVPGLARPLVKGYVDKLPAGLLGTGFNPWMAALIVKTQA